MLNWKLGEIKGTRLGLRGGTVQLGGVSLRTSLARSLLAQPGNPCKDNNQRDYREMSRNGKTQKTSREEEEEKNHLDLVNEHISCLAT